MRIKKPSPTRGRRHCGAVTDEVGQLHLRDAVHLISRLRRQIPLIGEGIGCVQIKNSPQKGADQQTWPAPSMDGRYSTATSYKSDTPVSGGAYQDARKVTIVWNDA